MSLYPLVIVLSWLAFLAVWTVGAARAKPDIRRGGAWALRFWSWRLVVIAIVLIIGTSSHWLAFSSHPIFHTNSITGWLGASLTVIGIAFAVWARIHLGRNWSSHPTHKAEHELVTSGPYAYVRHPIYTGVILALLGTVFIGYVYSLVLFVALSIMFVIRIHREERIMLELFPDQYPLYQARTKRLIPWIW